MPQSKRTEGGLDEVVGFDEARQLMTALAQLVTFDVQERQRLKAVREQREREAEKAAAERETETEKRKKEDKEVFRNREEYIVQCDLSPQSLVGSWFHRYENAEIRWQGLVVAEPQPGVYMVELHNWHDGGSAHQRVVSIRDIVEAEDGYEWRFYDDEKWMKMAMAQPKSAFEADREHA